MSHIGNMSQGMQAKANEPSSTVYSLHSGINSQSASPMSSHGTDSRQQEMPPPKVRPIRTNTDSMIPRSEPQTAFRTPLSAHAKLTGNEAHPRAGELFYDPMRYAWQDAFEILHGQINQLHRRIQELESKSVMSPMVEPVEDVPQSDSKSIDEPEDPRHLVLVKIYDEVAKEWVDLPEDGSHAIQRKPKTRQGRVLTYRKIHAEASRKIVDWELRVDSAPLLRKLKEAYDEVCPGDLTYSWGTEVMTFYSPFEQIVWPFDILVQWAAPLIEDTEDVKEQKADMRQLLDYVRQTPPLVDYFTARKTSPDTIAFKYIWTLFPFSAEIVASKVFPKPQIFRVYDLPSFGLNDDFEFKAWCFDHNGTEWVKAIYEFRVESYRGDKAIANLDFYPVEHHVENGKKAAETLRNLREEEGALFAKYCDLKGSDRLRTYSGAFMEYRGPNGADFFRAINGTQGLNWKWHKRSRVDGDVIVDPEVGALLQVPLQMGDEEALYVCYEDEVFPILHTPVSPLSGEPHWLRLCPSRIYGFRISNRTAVQLSVSNIGEAAKPDKEAYENELQLAQDSKKLLLSQVISHSQGRGGEEIVDSEDNKGNSLVILLHGAPGLGKTLTSEALAKAVGKPLLVCKVADIGLEPHLVEHRLSLMFGVAARWDAILLMDEADAFLEERRGGKQSLQQNALVIVMLRILEYFTGIVLLTTNRMLSLDPAVSSRVHIPIFYDKLGQRDLGAIFNHHLVKLNVSEEARRGLKDWFDEVPSETDMNGRAIRNMVHSAVALAEVQNRPVKVDDFRTVYKKIRLFEKQMDEKLQDWKMKSTGFARK